MEFDCTGDSTILTFLFAKISFSVYILQEAMSEILFPTFLNDAVLLD